MALLAARSAPAHAAAQLVQLRQAETFGVFNGYDRGLGHIHSDLYHSSCDQHLDPPFNEGGHGLVFLFRLHAAMDQADLIGAEYRGQSCVALFRRG